MGKVCLVLIRSQNIMKNAFLDLLNIRKDIYYLFVDSRYCLYEDDSFIECRLAISYGPNITIEMRGQILAPLVQPGECVYGLHEIVTYTNSDMLRIVDSWIDSYPAQNGEKLEEVIKKAEELLTGISDDKYGKFCSSNIQKPLEVKVRPVIKAEYCY